MTKDNAIDFLMFSYFGITIDEKDKYLSAAIDRAYIDAASHVLKFTFKDASQVKKSEREKYEGMIRKAYKNAARDLLTEKIKETAKHKFTTDTFRTWHSRLCTSLIGIYKKGEDILTEKNSGLKMFYEKCYGENKFSLGIAQKWINMTIKYLFILNALVNSFSDGNPLLAAVCANLVDVTDIPVDDYILQAASEKNVPIPCVGKNKKYSERRVDYKNKLPWSQWKNDSEAYYKDFQDELKAKKNENETILEFENRLWIETAKKRRESEKDTKED